MDKVWQRFLLGVLLIVLVMVPIGYLLRQSIRLLGYAEPGDAPIILQYAALTVTIMTLVIILHFATGDAYKELQKRRQKKRKRDEY
jgi:CDP-diglyceride synthetase